MSACVVVLHDPLSDRIEVRSISDHAEAFIESAARTLDAGDFAVRMRMRRSGAGRGRRCVFSERELRIAHPRLLGEIIANRMVSAGFGSEEIVEALYLIRVA